MRIALAQILSGRDPGENLEKVADAAATASDRGARLMVCPEATMRAFGSGRLDEIAEGTDGPWAGEVARIAREHGLVIAAGMFRPGPGGRVYNSLLVTGPSGGAGADSGDAAADLHLAYDKIHLFDAFGFAESDTVAAGEELVAIEVDGVTVGLTLCYDVRFPGQYRALAAERGATAIVCAASWGAGPGKVDQWRLLTRARALDSTCYLLAAGQADPAAEGVEVSGKAPTGIGHSLVAGPDGTVLAEAGAGAEVLVADLDPDLPGTIRRSIPVLDNGRVTE